MKIIYCCYGGSHSSVTAAAIHLGMLPITKKPTSRELLSVPYYEQQKGQEHGTLRFMGNDEYGNQVYIVGKHNLGHLFEDIIRQFATAFRISQGDFVIVDTIPYVNLAMMFGGFTSRRAGIPFIGRPIVVWGTKRAYFDLVTMVHRIKVTVAGRKANNGDTK